MKSPTHSARKASVILLALVSFTFNTASAASPPPNIVFILSDDQAWTDYGFMGHEDIQTPALDKLADKSILFKRGYVASPLCRPSLASFITGLYPYQNGITGNDVDRSEKRDELDRTMRSTFHKKPSFIKLLTENGYLAHQSGKWWEGSFTDGGFTHGMTHGDPAKKGRHGDEGLKIGRESMTPVTDFIDLAVEEKKPFLLWYAPFLPHTPHNPPERLLKKYKKPGRAKDVAKYYAMCEWFDETCGTLIDYLEQKDLTSNTMIIYACDNGWAATSTNADDPDQKKLKSYALRSKGSPYENGIRTPIMVSWPGKTSAVHNPNFAHGVDVFPTIVAAANIQPPADLPGVNLLDPEAVEARKIIYGSSHSSHNITLGDTDDTLQYLWCIEGDWKLILRYHGKDTTHYKSIHTWDKAKQRLYNLKDDPHEKNDLSAAHPETVAHLKRKIETWQPVKSKPTSRLRASAHHLIY